MAEETPQAEEATAPAEAKKGSSKLILIVGVVVLLGGGGGAAWFLGLIPGGGGGGDHGEAKAEAKGHHQPQVGAMLALDPFVGNLADEDAKRYLKATLQVEFFDSTVPEEFNERAPQMRDLLLTLFTSKTFAEIRSPDGKAVLREEIINRMNRALHKDLVKAVYFTDFIVQ
jgi:flagellar FliL protein